MTFNELKRVIFTKYELRIAELKAAHMFVEQFLRLKYGANKPGLSFSWSATHNVLEQYDGSWSLEVRGNELIINTSSVEHSLYDSLTVSEIQCRDNILVIYLTI